MSKRSGIGWSRLFVHQQHITWLLEAIIQCGPLLNMVPPNVWLTDWDPCYRNTTWQPISMDTITIFRWVSEFVTEIVGQSRLRTEHTDIRILIGRKTKKTQAGAVREREQKDSRCEKDWVSSFVSLPVSLRPCLLALAHYSNSRPFVTSMPAGKV